MTEETWLASNDPQAMLEFLGKRADRRKLCLFACACCRHIWPLLKDPRSQQAVELAERDADGLLSNKERRKGMSAAHKPRVAPGSRADTQAAHAAHMVLNGEAEEENVWGRILDVSLYARDAEENHTGGWDYYDNRPHPDQAHLLRDLFGNPFRPVTLNPVWLTWNDGTIRKLAEAIYNERAFDRMPILADALEDAGCADQQILEHCRGKGTHVKGCFVVDLILSKG